MDDQLPVELAERIRRRNGAATIYDIAELAGVTPSTVSRPGSRRVAPAWSAAQGRWSAGPAE